MENSQLRILELKNVIVEISHQNISGWLIELTWMKNRLGSWLRDLITCELLQNYPEPIRRVCKQTVLKKTNSKLRFLVYMFKFLSQSSTCMWYTKKIDVITKGKMFLPWSILMPVPLLFFFFWPCQCSLWDLYSPTRDQVQAPCSGNSRVLTTGHLGKPSE